MKITFKQKPIALLFSFFVYFPSLLQAQNLISNSSFESNGLLNCESWYDACGNEFTCDSTSPTCMGSFVQDVPSGGGDWSLSLIPGWIPSEGYAETYITGLSGTKIFQLKTWMKVVGGAIGNGYLCLYLKDQPFWFVTSCKGDSTSTWKQFIVIDTFTLQIDDTIVVHLSAGATEVAAWTVQFDLVELTVITDTSTGVDDYNYQSEIAVYPNPASDNLAMELSNQNSSADISIFNALGQFELSSRLTNHKTNLDISMLTNRMHIIEVRTNNNISRQKFIKE